jgi:hypothetical protein
VLHALAIASLAQKARDCCLILAQFFTENFDRNGAMLRVVRLKHRGGTTLADFTANRISCERLPDHIFARHGGEPNNGRKVWQASLWSRSARRQTGIRLGLAPGVGATNV